MNDVLSLISEINILKNNDSEILSVLDEEAVIDVSLDASASIEILRNVESTIP